MKVLILAGGFAKRMWPLTENQAKALLPVSGKPVIEYILDKLGNLGIIQEIYISTNQKFESDFKRYLSHLKIPKTIKLIIEPHKREEEKFGAVGGIHFFIETQQICDDLLIIAGDNLFQFEIKDLIEFGNQFQDSVIALYDIKDIEKVRNRFGVVELNENNVVTSFEEKPTEPLSSLISTGIYLLKKKDLHLVKTYIRAKNNPDAPGFFIRWLKDQRQVRGFTFEGKWFDIGSFQLYNEAQIAFRNLNRKTKRKRLLEAKIIQ